MIKKWILGEFIRDNLSKYTLGILALVVSSFLNLTIPKLLGYIIDLLKTPEVGQSRIFWLTFIMLAVSALLFVMKYTWRYFLMGRARDLECFLRAKLFAHLQTLPVKFYNNKKTGDLMAYAINDLNAVRQAFSFGIVSIIDGVIINLASLLVMVKTINPILTAVAIGPIIIAVVIIINMRKSIRERFIEVQEAFASVSEKIQENISGIRVVKAYVQEKSEIRKMEKASQHRMDVQMKYVRLSAFLAPSVQLCFGISYTLVIIIGSSYVSRGVISLGDFIAFNTYLALLTGPITNVGKIVEVWQKAMASIKRLDEIFLTKTDIVDDNPTYNEDKFKGDLRIQNLNFIYPGTTRRALRDINIELKAGKTLAIIGKTGSGKTTLINLLLRLYKLEYGHIFIDGVDINDMPISVLRDNIGCVPQDNFLFSATIKENIEFFKEGYTDDDVEEAAKMSSVYENIIDFPEGFETVVGERGITLSGGQKQRISIARAIIKDPSILILDDSLSAVDTKTEEEILTNIKEILKGRTGIIIAHRISTLKHADEIIVMDKGRIIEKGTHQSLLDVQGHYYKLYCAQLAETKLENVEEIAI